MQICAWESTKNTASAEWSRLQSLYRQDIIELGIGIGKLRLRRRCMTQEKTANEQRPQYIFRISDLSEKISGDNHRSHRALPERVFGCSVFLYPQLGQ